MYIVLSHNPAFEGDVRLHCVARDPAEARATFRAVVGARAGRMVELVEALEGWADPRVSGGSNLLFWREGGGPRAFRLIDSDAGEEEGG